MSPKIIGSLIKILLWLCQCFSTQNFGESIIGSTLDLLRRKVEAGDFT